MLKEIFERRSVREFSGKEVENEKIELLLRAAMQAPSAMNEQPWEFIVVNEKAILEKLSTIGIGASMVKDASVAIIILANEDRFHIKYKSIKEYMPPEMGSCCQNVLLEATHLGLGTVWVCGFPLEDRLTNLHRIFDFPKNILPFAVVAVGYPKDENANYFLDRFDESRITYNKYR